MSQLESWRGLLRRADALAEGLSDGELARLVRRGDLERLQRGAYLAPGTDVERHRLVVAATVAGLRRPGVVSHTSAAVLHGLPLWGTSTTRVHLIRRPPAAGSGSARVHLHVARLPDDQVTVVDGVLVTDVARTVVDLARTLPFEPAVVAADAALAARTVVPASLTACLADMGPVPGARRAARVLQFADGRSGSVGESRSRVLIRRIGLPAPELQVRVERPDGSVVGRSDFGWHAQRTLGEFDGRVKYGRLLRPGQDPGDAVFEEKLREDEMRDAGWQMARWTWGDLDRPGVVGARLHRAFSRGPRAA
ncbi:type IV toxin-antitoxin system AbiEi family antitoxin domain-containing protein [Geodermatophilus sp. CPCC 205506]|uniref:type IV toxin-antitoxin system AbiEi family antitoxin domain-containing protein n=1 Tax=Geodermatophilus sp. CPCC 205506 TaxID=2936596 RepID=UPI003EE9117C